MKVRVMFWLMCWSCSCRGMGGRSYELAVTLARRGGEFALSCAMVPRRQVRSEFIVVSECHSSACHSINSRFSIVSEIIVDNVLEAVYSHRRRSSEHQIGPRSATLPSPVSLLKRSLQVLPSSPAVTSDVYSCFRIPSHHR